MHLIRYRFTDPQHARQALRVMQASGATVNIQQTIQAGHIDLYTMDNDHRQRIEQKYKATAEEIPTAKQ